MMGDVGGLFSILIRIGLILTPWFSNKWSIAFLIKHLSYQRLKSVNQNSNQEQSLHQRIKDKLQNRRKAKISYHITILKFCCCRQKN